MVLKKRVLIEKMTAPLFISDPFHDAGIGNFRHFARSSRYFHHDWLDFWGADESYRCTEKLKWLLYTGYREDFNRAAHTLSGLPESTRRAYIRSLPETDPLKNRLIHAGPFMETLTFSGIAAFDYALYLTLFVSASKVGFQTRGEADVFRDKLFKIAYAKYRSWHEYFQACVAGIYFVLAQPERINELDGRHYAFLRQQADEQNPLRSFQWNELNA